MKKYYLFIIYILFITCDQIEAPYTTENLNIGLKKVIVEKFTGHKCSNRPDASTTLNELKEFYPNNIISIAIHPGNLIEFTNTDDNYPYDFTTESGDIIAQDMGAIFLPLATINRKPGGISNRCWTKDEWASEINDILYDNNGDPIPKNINITINNYYNPSLKEITSSINLEVINNLNGDYRLVALITEDKIISAQLDDTFLDANYEHNNILRASLNGVYGEDLNINFKSGTVINKEYNVAMNTTNNVNWTNSWNSPENCHVVVYIYNANTLIIEEAYTQPFIQ